MSRSEILERIKKNKPILVPLPDLGVFSHEISQKDMIVDFIKNSTLNGSNVVNIINPEVPLESFLKEFIAANFPDVAEIYDAANRTPDCLEVDFRLNVDLFIAEAKLGVAENACLWFDESIINQRISLFACEHTLLIIDSRNIVPTMHQAYTLLQINETGYGVFIAGPSKTADIEQSLVIGAQGAVSNTIILI